ncbi:hypothetical protein QKQ66_gp008 [Dione juno nucleopolyhedrovirus]|uniref:F-box domain-containing protein n=1 Tax=Dione juno nucleopolyhedrovirus TaxID=2594175 RepID=A0AAE6H3R5_9ABAC|nr:hypothetical protein QKQ66_gp008 [Dione juno nucleopolyhedrovirus]QDL56932.1 hypothetical protein DijuNPV-ORF-8 [Dione juno nucleopolyhedrovirus]
MMSLQQQQQEEERLVRQQRAARLARLYKAKMQSAEFRSKQSVAECDQARLARRQRADKMARLYKAKMQSEKFRKQTTNTNSDAAATFEFDECDENALAQAVDAAEVIVIDDDEPMSASTSADDEINDEMLIAAVDAASSSSSSTTDDDIDDETLAKAVDVAEMDDDIADEELVSAVNAVCLQDGGRIDVSPPPFVKNDGFDEALLQIACQTEAAKTSVIVNATLNKRSRKRKQPAPKKTTKRVKQTQGAPKKTPNKQKVKQTLFDQSLFSRLPVEMIQNVLSYVSIRDKINFDKCYNTIFSPYLPVKLVGEEVHIHNSDNYINCSIKSYRREGVTPIEWRHRLISNGELIKKPNNYQLCEYTFILIDNDFFGEVPRLHRYVKNNFEPDSYEAYVCHFLIHKKYLEYSCKVF